MLLNVKCFATLAPKSPPDNACELPDGADAARLMKCLGIPAEEVKIIFVNGVIADAAIVLREGDRVGLFPAVGGG